MTNFSFLFLDVSFEISHVYGGFLLFNFASRSWIWFWFQCKAIWTTNSYEKSKVLLYFSLISLYSSQRVFHHHGLSHRFHFIYVSNKISPKLSSSLFLLGISSENFFFFFVDRFKFIWDLIVKLEFFFISRLFW